MQAQTISSQVSQNEAAAREANARAQGQEITNQATAREQEARIRALGGQADVSQAQVAEIQNKIDTLMPAQSAQLYASAGQSVAQSQYLHAQLPEIVAKVRNLNSQSDLNALQGKLDQASTDQIRALLPALQTIRQNEAISTKLGLQSAENENNFQQTFWGYLSHFIAPVSSAVGAAVGGFAGSAVRSVASGSPKVSVPAGLPPEGMR